MYQNGTYEDQYIFSMDLNQQSNDMFRANFQYQAAGPKNQTQLQFWMEAKQIFEYDSNSQEVYEGNAKIFSQWPSPGTGASWNNWVNHSRTENGVPLFIYSADSTDGLLTIRVHASPKDLHVANAPSLSPNDVKMDFEIHKYPFGKAPSRLCMQVNVVSQTESTNSGEGAVSSNSMLLFKTGTDLPFGAFSWSNSVITIPKNKTVPIVAWSPNNTQATSTPFYFSFLAPSGASDRPTDLIWDPRVGLFYPSPVLCVGQVCGVGAIVIVVVIVVLGVVMLAMGGLWMVVKRKQRYQRIQ